MTYKLTNEQFKKKFPNLFAAMRAVYYDGGGSTMRDEEFNCLERLQLFDLGIDDANKAEAELKGMTPEQADDWAMLEDFQEEPRETWRQRWDEEINRRFENFPVAMRILNVLFG